MPDVRESTWLRFVAGFNATWRSQPLSEADAVVWRNALKDVPEEALLKAIVGLSQREFAPSWAQVRAQAQAVLKGAEPSMGEALREIGAVILSSERPEFWSHPVVARFVQRVGWRELRMAPAVGEPYRGAWEQRMAREWEAARQDVQGRLTGELPGVPPSIAELTVRRAQALAAGDEAAVFEADAVLRKELGAGPSDVLPLPETAAVARELQARIEAGRVALHAEDDEAVAERRKRLKAWQAADERRQAADGAVVAPAAGAVEAAAAQAKPEGEA